MTKKQLPKPEYWTDFEDLCKKLWGEIWKCPEIKKNGRKGQEQHGVDVYGIPFGETQFYGIQCKGKDEYSHSKLTIKEIDSEIEKVKKFTPPLKKLYFVTTSNKDSLIEEYVRSRDVEHRTTGLFEVHIYSWEDIVDLITENKHTHDWYCEKKGFRNSFNVELEFSDGTLIKHFSPIFIKETTRHIDISFMEIIDFEDPMWDDFKNPKLPFQKKIKSKEDLLEYFLKKPEEESIEEYNDPQPIRRSFTFPSYMDITTNHSTCKFSLILKNTGTSVLEDYKIYLDFENVISIDTVNKRMGFYDIKHEYNVYFNTDSPHRGVFEPRETILVQGDSILLDEICFKPKPEQYSSTLKWSLFSRDYKTNGELSFTINPVFEESERDIYVKNPSCILSPTERICNKYTYEIGIHQ
jgi:hypothetical protein